MTAMRATVVANRKLTEHMTRVTVHCAELDRFDHVGPDQLVRLFLPPSRDAELNLPAGERWWPEVQAMPEPRRPIVRNYTVRAIDRITGELHIDFVLHGDSGPASAWAHRAAPGDEIGVLSDGADYAPPAGTRSQLLIGDETALPAVAAILENLAPSTRGLAMLEVAGPAVELPLSRPDAVDLHWLHRGSRPYGELVLEHLLTASLDPADCYVWVAGESSLATSVRRHLVQHRGFGKGQIYFCGYWRR